MLTGPFRSPREPHIAHWQRRSSRTARWALLLYGLVLGSASLQPWSGWRDNGTSPWEFLFAPWPKFWTGFDVFTNCLAYFPFGALLVWALYPRLRNGLALLLAVALASVMSALLEALQTYLPLRISSNLDLLCNALGAGSGALFGVLTASHFIDRGRLRDWRFRWFEREASAGLVWLGSWLVAQLYPQALAFTTGEITPLLESVWPDFLNAASNGSKFWELGEFSMEQRLVGEAIAASTAVGGAALFFTRLMRPNAPRLRLLAAWVGLTIAAKLMAAALFFPDMAFYWATPVALLGLSAGTAFAAGVSFAPRQIQSVCALLALFISVMVVNFMPENPYFVMWLSEWRQGVWSNFNRLLISVALVWPFVAAFYLLRRG